MTGLGWTTVVAAAVAGLRTLAWTRWRGMCDQVCGCWAQHAVSACICCPGPELAPAPSCFVVQATRMGAVAVRRPKVGDTPARGRHFLRPDSIISGQQYA